MWFLCALATTLLWGAADLFYKKGSNPADKYSHLKIVVMVGLVMGAHGLIYMLTGQIEFHPMELVRYLPVSAMYILSMAVGYFGLRYIELSISSPVQNASGAVTALLIFIFFTHTLGVLEITGIVAVTAGIVGLGVLEKREERRVVTTMDKASDVKYRVGFLAIIFPILYCIIDGLGTFFDAVYLDEMELISESSALLAYEFTFFICAALVFLYLRFVKKENMNPFRERDRGIAALFETGGQFFYVFAMAENAIIAAPLIASYSVVSVLLSRLFLKEKLTKKQYVLIIVVMLGIALLGLSEEL